MYFDGSLWEHVNVFLVFDGSLWETIYNSFFSWIVLMYTGCTFCLSYIIIFRIQRLLSTFSRIIYKIIQKSVMYVNRTYHLYKVSVDAIPIMPYHCRIIIVFIYRFIFKWLYTILVYTFIAILSKNFSRTFSKEKFFFDQICIEIMN